MYFVCLCFDISSMQLCRNRQCVALQLTACPAANGQECAGNGVREALLVIIGVYIAIHLVCFLIQVCNDLNRCSCNPGFTGANCNSLVNGGGGGCG